ncbi:hypothetical protein SASPL_129061 [Salvia splendens]|uniref:RRM domain-containing protein n=1 Tax=Salvia splendens TaxID=180675 RepID=A0A8X8XFC0_SALSN|nr:serine/arginine-rich SC35-like splicing factor SCL33 isoform X2 [Salvia splendens]KAG6410988.1 hypothetical protein SASPL_129061 [Salvia splendens]
MRRRYSRSPSPRGYRRGCQSPSPRGRYRSRGRDLPTSLLVRNLRHDCRTEDLRGPFGEFGPLKDIYLPRDYYTGQPRGFGFVQYVDPDDATEAKYHMDGQSLLGRELTVVFAEENRKKPSEMRSCERIRSSSRFSGHLGTEVLTLRHHAIVVPTPKAPVLVLAIILPLQGADTAPDPSCLVGEGTERDPIRGLPTKAGARVRSEAGAGAQRTTDVIVCDIWGLYFSS